MELGSEILDKIIVATKKACSACLLFFKKHSFYALMFTRNGPVATVLPLSL